ncbi:MAG: 1-acyl-sn-glycerol-3-phosphate acyltransferase [Bauldia sp.]|nr:1-acyl-sn-glycerol-3-phosphate acyltransferase [Bauldia sp.]
MGMARTIFVAFVLGIVTIVLMPLQILATRFGWRLAALLPYYWQRIARWLVGLRVRVTGTPAKPPLLLTANHISWLDITVLGSVMPLSFVAKAEVAGWPVLGTLARLQRTVFIDRTKRLQTGAATAEIAQRVGAGDVMVLFAEGTTGDGNRILPFRSALIGAAGAAAGTGTITVQPVAVTYTRIGGIPVGASDRPGLAWYGEMPFVAHFSRLIGRGGIDAVVSFGEPIHFTPESDRKKVAEECFESVREMDELARTATSYSGKGDRLFSPQPKNAKGTGSPAAANLAGQAGEGIVDRVS